MLRYLLIALLCCGCQFRPQRGTRVPTCPVSGSIAVDGRPMAGLKVECHRTASESPQVLIPSAISGPDGHFSISSYEAGDGAPAGDYRLTFQWGEYSLLSGKYEGDKFNGRYADPDSSDFDLKVTDRPIDLGQIELLAK